MAPTPSSTVEELLHLQRTLEDFGEPLSQTTFVTVDLETTGGSPVSSMITEIGAVKTRGGEVIGEFQTLVNPGLAIPPMIVALTGITDAMVIGAPPIEEVLPAFLEFLGDAVLVAHNAPFDTGFLRAACRTHGYKWPGSEVVDTVTLARRATTKGRGSQQEALHPRSRVRHRGHAEPPRAPRRSRHCRDHAQDV